MKFITCFISSLSSGGAEHQITELARLLVVNNKVTIVTFSDVQDHYPVDAKIKRVRLAQGKSKIHKLFSVFRYFINTETECIISYGQRENLFVLLPLLFRKKIKILAGERNLSYGSSIIIEWVLFNILYRRADYIVPNSFSQQKYILNKKPVYEYKIVVINNYANLSRYVIKNYPDNTLIRIGIFARYNKQKNYKRFAEAMELVKEKIGERFIVMWYGNQMFKDTVPNPDYLSFKEIVEGKKLKNIIQLNDHVKNVDELLPDFDAVCLPSLYEGFSNSISEAICCGKPMLVSDVSDNSIMVHDNENGFLFNPLDINDMVNAFLKFFALTIEERTLMGLNSRKIAEELFDEKIFRSKYTYLIEC